MLKVAEIFIYMTLSDFPGIDHSCVSSLFKRLTMSCENFYSVSFPVYFKWSVRLSLCLSVSIHFGSSPSSHVSLLFCLSISISSVLILGFCLIHEQHIENISSNVVCVVNCILFFLSFLLVLFPLHLFSQLIVCDVVP